DAPTDGPPQEQASFAELAAEDQFEKVRLACIPEPITLDIAPDGRVITTRRHGGTRALPPHTPYTTVPAELSGIDDHPLPPHADIEGSKNQEGGLLGLALDPDFEENGWVYAYYTSREENNHILSRFVMEGDEIDVSSEVQMLRVPYN